MHWLLIPWFKLEPISLGWPDGPALKVQPFGVLAALAMLVSARFAARRAAQLGIHPSLLSSFLTRVTIVGVVSAYVLNIVMYAPDEVRQIVAQPARLLQHWYGLSSYGGFLGGAMAAWWFARRRGASLLALGDAWCFGFPFGWFFARLGCFSVHDHPGVASDFFLAVADYNGGGVARHDLGLYEVLWSVPVLLWFWRSSLERRAAGYYLAQLLCLYGPVRFVLDFLRAPDAIGGDIRYAGLTPAQYLSMLVAAIGMALCVRLRAWPGIDVVRDSG